MTDAYRSWNIADPETKGHGFSRDSKGHVRPAFREDWMIVHSSTEAVKQIVTSVDQFREHFPDASPQDVRDVERAFRSCRNLYLTCYPAQR